MIEINLLPGKRKQAKGGGSSVNFAGIGQAIVARVKDPYLIGSMAVAILAVVIVGFMFLRQEARERSLLEKEQKAVQDSTRYAAVLREKARAEAQRDTVARQLNIIRSIDNNRFVWPHLLDEISRALPPYTWLTSVQQSSPPQSAAAMTLPKPGEDEAVTAARKKKGLDTTAVEDTLKFRIVGNTIDVQALTRFITLLEASPFVRNVSLFRMTPVIEHDKQVAEFQLDAEWQKPDSSAIRVVPVLQTLRQ
jgi:Tfp pilus assembly protein PilN